MPSATISRNSSTARAPRTGPSMTPASMMPRVWAVIGTLPVIGVVKAGR